MIQRFWERSDRPPVRLSVSSLANVDSRTESALRTPQVSASGGLWLANSEAGELALAPESSVTTGHTGSSRKRTTRSCA